MIPEEVTVIVCGAKNLKTRKKGKSKYSVIFGVGSKKFRTDSVNEENGNPVWNEQSTIEVTNVEQNVFFTVTNKDEVLGQVSFPLANVPSTINHRRQKADLEPHKKAPNPQGELLYECWVSRYAESKTRISVSSSEDVPTPSPTVKHKSFKKFRNSLKGSGHRRSKTEGLPEDTTRKGSGLGRLGSKSMLDISSLSPDSGKLTLSKASSNPDLSVLSESNVLEVPQSGRHGSKSSFGSRTSVTDSDIIPEIVSIFPTEGPIEGGTRIIIEGFNLGEYKEDIIGLNICGANCLASLEYESSCRVYCTTKAWRVSSGKITLETQTGGKGASDLNFSFVENNKSVLSGNQNEETVDIKKPSKRDSKKERNLFGKITNSIGLNERKENVEENSLFSKSKEDLIVELTKLKNENQALKEENRNMKNYIDNLVARVINEYPQALQVGKL